MVYAPHLLSDLDDARRRLLGEISDELKKNLKGRPLFFRYDFPWDISELSEFHPKATWGIPKLQKAVMDIQPPSTVVVSLQGSEEEILQAMKKKNRYNIRLAGRKGVEVQVEGESFLPQWYELYKETAERDNISIHSLDYYSTLFSLAGRMQPNAPELYILAARHEGELLAGIILSIYGDTATYMYGASSSHKRNLMASYAVQWEAMKLARSKGCLRYDLFGIPPTDDPDHPMHGLYRFKTGFGGRVIHRPGAWDYPVSRPVYALYRRAEKFRYWYFKKFKKR